MSTQENLEIAVAQSRRRLANLVSRIRVAAHRESVPPPPSQEEAPLTVSAPAVVGAAILGVVAFGAWAGYMVFRKRPSRLDRLIEGFAPPPQPGLVRTALRAAALNLLVMGATEIGRRAVTRALLASEESDPRALGE
ncbi:MAG: hypothetical protein HOO96_24620 [Polyangiaceae bacterium]|nr:hypothetical protein [Polyangiaceae bacterium]